VQGTPEVVNESIRVIDLAGVLGNAILGGIAARAARLDPVGFVVLAILSGLGGGMIRDTLLQRGTPAALVDPSYLIVALAGAAIALLLKLTGRWTQRGLTLLDALAVGCWAAVGVQKTLDAGLGWLPAILLGVITAIGGGMVRDVLLMRVPAVFGGNTLYATSALLASVAMLVLSELGQPEIGAIVAILSGAGLSLLARRFGWVLPTDVGLRKPKALSGWWERLSRIGNITKGKRNEDGAD
jgi:uncharacterized membrane protein YeiH